MLKFAASLGMVLCLVTQAAAQSTVFIVRHAERADDSGGAPLKMGADPDLSGAGRVRSDSLASLLSDARVTTIFATEFKRSQQTASPLAKALNVRVTTVSSKEPATLAQQVKAAPGNVLVVGHTNSIPDLLKALGVDGSVKIGESDYDNLFIVVRGEKPTLVRLHYR
jgi:2,3-bisphosphoglycerate-dependent phosphoglycerate mutase